MVVQFSKNAELFVWDLLEKMLQFGAGVEPLPSRIVMWSDTFLEHEKANHSDVIGNHPFNYRMEIVLNYGRKGLVTYDNKTTSSSLESASYKDHIQNILNMCTDFKDKSTIFTCSNIQPIDIISYVQEYLSNNSSSDTLLIYCHTLGAQTDSLTANQMAIYPIRVRDGEHGFKWEHHLRFRFDKETLLEVGLQRNEKNKTNSKLTSAHSAAYESDNYSTIGYTLPFKPKSKEYERLEWSLNREDTFPIHCYFGIYSVNRNCWIDLDGFEKWVHGKESKNLEKKERAIIKKNIGADLFNVRILKEENILLPSIDLNLEDILNGTTTKSKQEQQRPKLQTIMDEASDDEEENPNENVESDEDDEDEYFSPMLFKKEISEEEEQEVLKHETAKSILTCVGLLSGGMGSEFLSTGTDKSLDEQDVISQKNALLFKNSIINSDVTFSNVENSFVIKMEGILPPLFIEQVFQTVWKEMKQQESCWHAFLVTGMEDSVVSWRKFNHTYSLSGENDYLYVLFPKTVTKDETIVTPNWLLQILNQQDEFS